jgi:hypothetical protein
MDDAFCEYIGKMVCIPVGLFVKSRKMSSLADDPPLPNASTTCHACGAEILNGKPGALLCAACRSITIVKSGEPLIRTMYRSANPKYVLTKRMEAIVASIGGQRDVASYENKLVMHLGDQCMAVFDAWKAGNHSANICLDPEQVKYQLYGRAMVCCNPRYTDESDTGWGTHVAWPRHSALEVGGLGLYLQSDVQNMVVEWLFNLDAMIRRHFNIPLTRGYGDSSLRAAVYSFAELITNRVVLLEEQIDDDATQHVCTEGFEHRAEMEEVRCKHMAARQCSSDVRSMRELMAIARDGVVPEDPRRLIEFLGSPCPELIRALPGVCVSTAMRFMELQDLLQEGRDTARRLRIWTESINAGALCVLLEGAIRQAQEWKMSSFLHCLRHDAKPVAEHLPPLGWADDPKIASWSLIGKKIHAQRRTGFDPMGMRIVLMSSALIQINGNGGHFQPGLLRCDVVSPVVHRHHIRTVHATKALSEQLNPYMTGEPWKFARAEMTQWQGSYMENDVRTAAILLGRFSVQEIVARYGNPERLKLLGGLVGRTTEKMVFKPAAQYEQWFPVAVDLVLPILVQLRQSLGVASHVTIDALDDALQLSARVRAWTPTDGNLRLTPAEIKASPRLKLMLEHELNKKEQWPLVRKEKQMEGGRRIMFWILDGPRLAKRLGK